MKKYCVYMDDRTVVDITADGCELQKTPFVLTFTKDGSAVAQFWAGVVGWKEAE